MRNSIKSWTFIYISEGDDINLQFKIAYNIFYHETKNAGNHTSKNKLIEELQKKKHPLLLTGEYEEDKRKGNSFWKLNIQMDVL